MVGAGQVGSAYEKDGAPRRIHDLEWMDGLGMRKGGKEDWSGGKR